MSETIEQGSSFPLEFEVLSYLGKSCKIFDKFSCKSILLWYFHSSYLGKIRSWSPMEHLSPTPVFNIVLILWNKGMTIKLNSIQSFELDLRQTISLDQVQYGTWDWHNICKFLSRALHSRINKTSLNSKFGLLPLWTTHWRLK